MKLMYAGLIAISVLISVPYLLPADALEMKQVPFWWSTDPLTGEEVYTDYFKQASAVQQEHNTYLASIAKDQTPSTINPSILLEVERSNMVEVITYETKYIRAGDSAFYQGPFANPDYMISEKVAVTTWIESPIVVEVVITEDVTPDVTPIVTDITPDVTPIVPVIMIDVVEVVEEPKRQASGHSETHWDAEEQYMEGHSDMTTQELKDLKKKHAAWKAYDMLSKMMPSIYPPYVHYEQVVEDVVIETPKVVVPMMESEVIEYVPTSPIPNVTSNTVVVPMPEPVPEPTPRVTSSEIVVQEPAPVQVPGVTSSEVIDSTSVMVEEDRFEEDLTVEQWNGELDIIKQFPESLTSGATPPLIPGIPTIQDFDPSDVNLP